jgi:hypothetical protein
MLVSLAPAVKHVSRVAERDRLLAAYGAESWGSLELVGCEGHDRGSARV